MFDSLGLVHDSDSLFVQLAIQRGLTTQQTADECVRLSNQSPGQRLASILAMRAAIPGDVARRLMAEAEEIARQPRPPHASDLRGYVSDTSGYAQPTGLSSSGQDSSSAAHTPTPYQGDSSHGGPAPPDWKTAHGAPSHVVVSPAALKAGAIFGRYRLEQELGRGGMGVVWKARQADLDRDVAIKMLLQGALANQKMRGRFEAEAKAVARLVHPNVVTVHDVGDQSGILYFTMDFVDGPSLAQFLKTQTLSVKRALELTLGLAEGLDHAHRQGIYHRDLKPANILIDPRGTPRITDFGIAKDTRQISTTVPGEVLGTPSYMSPEQADGRAHGIDGRADIYSLGAILYRILTGAPPFTGETNYDIIQRVLHDPLIPPRKKAKAIPPEVDALIVKCLQREPDGRFASAAELAAELRRALRRYERETQEHRAPDGQKRLAIVLATAGLVALIGAVAFVQHRKNLQLQARLEQERLQRQQEETAANERRKQEAAANDLETARAILATQPEQALTKARAAAAVLVSDPDAQVLLGQLLLEVEKNPEGALAPLHAALTLEANRLDALRLKGRCLLALDRADEAEALAHLLEGLKTNPARAAAAELRCDLALGRKQLSVAVVHLDQAVRNAQDDPRLHLRMARLLVEARRYATAEESASRAIDLDPSNGEPYALRAKARLALNRASDAKQDAGDALTRDPGNPLAKQVQEEALEALRRAERPPRRPPGVPQPGQVPTDPKARHQYVHTLLNQARLSLERRDVERAKQVFAQADRLEPAPNCKGEVSLRIAILIALSGPEAGVAEAERYRRAHPADASGPEFVLQAYLAARRYPELISAADGLIAQAPPQSNLFLLRAKARIELAQLDQALDDLNLAVTHATPQLVVGATHERAHVYARLERFEEALADTDACLSQVPSAGHFRFMQGEYLMALGRNDQAKEAFNRAISMNLNPGELEAARAALQRLGGS